MARKKTIPLIGDQLRAAIAEDERTPYGLARESGVDERVIRRFLSGERGITMDSAERIARALGLWLRKW